MSTEAKSNGPKSTTTGSGFTLDHLCKNSNLHWVAGRETANRSLDSIGEADHATIIGHLNLIHRNRIQVIGKTELAYLDSTEDNLRKELMEQICTQDTFAVIFSDGVEINDACREMASGHNIPVLSSNMDSNDLIDAIRHYFSTIVAKKTTLHGVFMEVLGIGVLITGASSVGKSELALELLTRGHRLIADDAPEFMKVGPGTLDGRSPELLKDFIEVRGLGVLNIRQMYGDNALKQNKFLRLIIRMERMNAEDRQQLDRLYGARIITDVLGIEIPEIIIPVAPGRNLAVIVEAAIHNHILLTKGYNSTDDFVNRQRQRLEDEQ